MHFVRIIQITVEIGHAHEFEAGTTGKLLNQGLHGLAVTGLVRAGVTVPGGDRKIGKYNFFFREQQVINDAVQ